MKRRYILIIWSILLTLLPLLNGCIREEEFDNTPQGNFEALWKIINEQYLLPGLQANRLGCHP